MTASEAQASEVFPEFDSPPVVETASSVVFVPIQGWTLSHFAKFARRVEETYPSLEPQERQIVSQLEEFDKPPAWASSNAKHVPLKPTFQLRFALGFLFTWASDTRALYP